MLLDLGLGKITGQHQIWNRRMTRSQSIANRLSEVFLEGRWIANTNYRDQLESVDWEKAIQKVGNLNTIAALTYHINYYLEGLLKVFEGGRLEIQDKYSFDVPPIVSKVDWETLKGAFFTNAEKFVAQVRKMDDSLLEKPFVDEKYGSYSRNIEGVIEHSYYHLGQLVLIKKMIREH